MAIEIMHTYKTIQETLTDLRRLFRRHLIEDFEAVPGDGKVYNVRYHNGQTWIDIGSGMQSTKAANLRQCYQVIESILRWQIRGVAGLAGGQAFVGGGLATTSQSPLKSIGDEFIEACGILGVEPDASWDEIHDVFRVKSKRAHPDAGGDPERFKRLKNALEVIRKVKNK